MWETADVNAAAGADGTCEKLLERLGFPYSSHTKQVPALLFLLLCLPHPMLAVSVTCRALLAQLELETWCAGEHALRRREAAAAAGRRAGCPAQRAAARRGESWVSCMRQ